MKYLIIIAVVFIGLWLWRSNRPDKRKEKSESSNPRSSTALAPTEIVACDVCAVHLPRSEALPGGSGVYCSDAHRKQAEG